MPALKVYIIFVHPRGVVFPRDLYISAGINGFIILKLSSFFFSSLLFRLINANISVTARMVPLGTPAVAILYILTSRTRFRSWSFYRYRKRFGDLDHCSSSTNNLAHAQTLSRMSSLSGRMNIARVNIGLFTGFKKIKQRRVSFVLGYLRMIL